MALSESGETGLSAEKLLRAFLGNGYNSSNLRGMENAGSGSCTAGWPKPLCSEAVCTKAGQTGAWTEAEAYKSIETASLLVFCQIVKGMQLV